jgi:hypothetical protein
MNSSAGLPTDPNLTRNFVDRMRRGAQAVSNSAHKFVGVSKANLSFAAFHDYVSPFFSRSAPRPDGFHSSISMAQEGEGSCIQGQHSFVVNDRSALEYVMASPTPDAQRDAARTGDDASRHAGEAMAKSSDSVPERRAPLPSRTPIRESEDVNFLEFATALKQMQNSDVNSSSMARDHSGQNISRVSMFDTSATNSEISAILNSGANDDHISGVQIGNHGISPVNSEISAGSDYLRVAQAAITLKATRTREIQRDGEIRILTDARVTSSKVSDILSPLISDPLDAHRGVSVAEGGMLVTTSTPTYQKERAGTLESRIPSGTMHFPVPANRRGRGRAEMIVDMGRGVRFGGENTDTRDLKCHG